MVYFAKKFYKKNCENKDYPLTQSILKVNEA